MNKKMSKRQRDLKAKLMAAICMLLVSSIMMVSTTYAWFTLSTAPEVTGITTAVGANGNLEMALLPSYAMDATQGTAANDYGVTTGVGDSVKDVNLRNSTWGNLVELSAVGNNYGMDKMVLYPAALNVATSDASGLNPETVDAGTLLMTPTYGADGRVSELVKNTVTSLFSTENGGSFPQIAGYGVRAIGTAAGMTDRQLAYRNAISGANTAMAQAKTNAATSLNTNGQALANIAMAKATDRVEFTADEVASLLGVVNDLLGTNGSTGVLQYVENAYKQYIIAYAASAANQPVYNGEGEEATKVSGMTDDEFSLVAAAINGCADVDALITTLTSNGISISGIDTALQALKATKATVSTAKTELEALASGATWTELSTPLNRLAKMDAMTINGYTIDNVKDNLNGLVTDVASGKGITVTMASGGGVYADVADHCGDYTASVKLSNISYGGVGPLNLDATMATDSTLPASYLSGVGAAASGAGAPSGDTGETIPITDLYGYIIDLAFRTNAAESNLLLQTTPADRIYTDNKDTTADTMGHGSTMTFTATNAGFTQDQMIALMNAIRIVFMDPMSGSVYSTAMVDASTAVKSGDGMSVTGDIYIYENKDSVTSYREPIGEETATHKQIANYVEVLDGTAASYYYDDATSTYVLIDETHTAPDGAKLYNFDKYTYEAATEGATHVQVVSAKGPALIKAQSEAVIAPLVQNQVKTVSALVYLDGELVGNDDVAATAATSMTGSLNLQFASSANLVPMNYTPLMTQGTSTPPTTTEAVVNGG